MKEWTIEELLQHPDAIAIDVRSPIEYEEGSIPDSINIPLFTNEERQEIGTLYKVEGSDAAKWRAMETVAPKLPQLLGEIRGLIETGKKPVVYCWRGGMRSKSVASFAVFSGLNVARVTGGYRAYRKYILETMEDMLPARAVVLHGMTGSGKTLILKSLSEKGYPVLDLEEIANHRGSVFGSFGLGKPHNQKIFDSLLFKELRNLKDADYFLMEAESKRIGHAVQPDFMVAARENALHIHVEASLEKRVERTYKEYVEQFQDEQWFKDKVELALRNILKRINNPEIIQEITRAANNEDYRKLIELLYVYYYDTRYNHKEKEFADRLTVVNADSIEAAAKQLEHILQNAGYAMPEEILQKNQITK
ncbi:tRNA 2-selenouridine(34) synthase MnmH [Peribacillus saganii]|uniref:tRNA 2-selenouridine(34) synthase MnmH n=1 Tax=Peribacillus saganii TaxID=2303992 RepID=A0A372LJ29_9BACI|nr:tRNA 2-selenouridine(34) synthase MnmH [Peribacillus saganii]RFU66407.1 tRNA 2-selenouridine(34) synthase MnmH [Peribacillus saganii]